MEATKRTPRFSCKCKLCKAKWTTEKDRTLTFTEHEVKCTRYAAIFAKRRAMFPQFSESAERYQMSVLYFEYQRIHGHYNAAIKCDGRCMGATGHNCECSCGGANHGISVGA